MGAPALRHLPTYNYSDAYLKHVLFSSQTTDSEASVHPHPLPTLSLSFLHFVDYHTERFMDRCWEETILCYLESSELIWEGT